MDTTKTIHLGHFSRDVAVQKRAQALAIVCEEMKKSDPMTHEEMKAHLEELKIREV